MPLPKSKLEVRYMNKNIFLLLIITLLFSTLLIAQTDVNKTFPKGEDIIVDEEDNVEEDYERLAILFGVDYYDHDNPLYYAVRDIKDVAKVLLDKGTFQTEEYENPTKRMIEETIEKVINRVELGEIKTLVFYFAGRGYQDENYIYFSARDTDPNNISDTGFNLDLFIKDLEDLFKKVNERKSELLDNGLKIVVFTDSGRRKVSGLDKNVGLKSWATGEGLSLLYSTSHNNVSWEIGKFQNGLFTEFLLSGFSSCKADYNNDGYITFTEIGDYTKTEVSEWANNNGVDQVPQINNDGWKNGEFFLVECE